ncbi:uncharacterized protein BDV14DRAFT_159229 [Aspergillus stella-maris]|uniref:uncharacterized protein n=1 Tax=Aspergillus stella-maris TaxID=1810926 RepID=UPI003CCE21CB
MDLADTSASLAPCALLSQFVAPALNTLPRTTSCPAIMLAYPSPYTSHPIKRLSILTDCRGWLAQGRYCRIILSTLCHGHGISLELLFGCSILRRTICILILGFRPLGDTRNKTILFSVPFYCEYLSSPQQFLQGAITAFPWNDRCIHRTQIMDSSMHFRGVSFAVDHIPVACELLFEACRMSNLQLQL